MLSIQDLTIRFGGVVALDAVSLSIPEGVVFGLIGPNGAGKTTCFNCISGLYRPQGGKVLLNGTDLLKLPRHEVARHGVSRTFQNVALYGSLSVLENVMVGAQSKTPVSLLSSALGTARTRRAEGEITERALEMLEFMGLRPVADRGVSELSIGTQHRVEIARALMSSPKVLMLDEPAAGLTGFEVAALRETLIDLHRRLKLTMVIVEHNMRFVMQTCTEIGVLNFGRKIAQGSPDVIRANPEVIEAYLAGTA